MPRLDRGPTRRAAELMQQLVHVGNRRPSAKDSLRALAELRELAEPATLPVVFELVADADADVARAAAELSSRLLQDVEPTSLPLLDSWMRARGRGQDGWLRADLRPCLRHPAQAMDLLCLASMAPLGVVREAAVRRLAREHGHAVLPFLLLRRNDWVRQVREPAMSALDERLRPSELAAWVSVLPLVTRLRDCGRSTHAEFVDRVLELVREGDARSLLLAGVASRDPRVRREVVGTLAHADEECLLDAVELARQVGDPPLRLRLGEAAVERCSPENLERVLQAMSVDPYPPLRRRSIEVRSQRLPDTLSGPVTAGLDDPASSVRLACQYFHRARLGGDPAAHYRRRLASSELATLALFGLTECGDERDVPVFVGRLDDERNRTREAAVLGLARHGSPEHEERFWSALEDHAGRVRRAAVTGLLRLGTVSLPRLLSFLRDDRPELRVTVRSLLTGLPIPERLIALLALHSSPELDGELADDDLRRWLVRSNYPLVRISPEQVRQVRERLADCCCSLAMKREVLFRVESPTG
ncbi:MAG: HEAT repeat domain-containing protein [Acidobacteriota bacterium]